MKTVFALSALGLISMGTYSAIGFGKPQPTYADAVAPILNKNCVSCHRPGEVAPFSLVGYENAKKYAPMITAVTKQGLMPPWRAVEGHGEFLDEKRLTREELETLKGWSDAGAPRGEAKNEPKPPSYPEGWALGKPDLVLSPKTTITLGPEGPDEYRNFVLENKSNETRYVTAIDCKPGNRKVVHHLVVFVDGSDTAKKRDAADKDGQEGYTTFGGPGFNPAGILGVWVPGYNIRHTAPGTAFELKAGHTVVMQVHYHRSGKPEQDKSELGIYFAKAKPAKVARFGIFVDPTLRIEAGDKNYRLTRTFKIPTEMTLYGVMPHMHLLGKQMKVDAETPDGRKIPLIYIKDWDFNWQMQYDFKKPVVLPAGSKVTVEGVYDNSADNPRNPNFPPKPVHFGEETTDEMFVLLFTQTSAIDQPFFGVGGTNR